MTSTMTSTQNQTIDYIATLSAELASMAETTSHPSLAYILRMAEMEARRLAADGMPVKVAA